MRLRRIGAWAVLALFLFAPCAARGQALYDFSALNGKRVGVLSGSWFDQSLMETAPQAVPCYYNSSTDAGQALLSGKIDAYIDEEPMIKMLVGSVAGLTYISKPLADTAYAYAFSKDAGALVEDFNRALEALRAEGVVRDCVARWIEGDSDTAPLPDIALTGERGTLTLATSATSQPFVFLRPDGIVGYDVEIAMRVCQKLGYALNIREMDFTALLPCVVSGKADFAAACLTITPERARSVLFSAPNYAGHVLVAVRGEPAPVDLVAQIKDSFVKTFVTEARWRMILEGLGVTLLISLLSLIAGSVLGFGVCMAHRSRGRLARATAHAYVQVVQGVPVVVFLMILSYVVMKNASSEILVAVVGFSVNFSASACEIMRAGIEDVDNGQREAALAIGFTRIQAFWRIVFPQAARHFLPVYKGEFISMVKMTSVVGYIAIDDLTKATDIIRSRTFDSFFPLFITALIYYVLANLLAVLLTLIEVRIDPKQRKRRIKGVDIF